jgi:membrane-bound ClpP family serine protease
LLRRDKCRLTVSFVRPSKNPIDTERLADHRIDRWLHLISENDTMLSTILIVILILILIGALPSWPYSSGWGYGPGGLVGTILIIVVILALLGRI